MQWEPENCGIHVNLVLSGHAIKLHFVTFNNYKNKMIRRPLFNGETLKTVRIRKLKFLDFS